MIPLRKLAPTILLFATIMAVLSGCGGDVVTTTNQPADTPATLSEPPQLVAPVAPSSSSQASPSQSAANTAAVISLDGTKCHVAGPAIDVVTSDCSIVTSPSAPCHTNPPPYQGVAPYQIQVPDQAPITVGHEALICDAAFSEEVDFAYLGDTPTCAASGGTITTARPCAAPLHAGPSFISPVVPGVAIEGQSVQVNCQSYGNLIFSDGVLRNAGPDGHNWYTNIWDHVQLPGNQSGWIIDLWLGNLGWRHIAC